MDLETLFYGKVINLLLNSKAIEVSGNFHVQCGYVDDVISNDVTGIVNTILEYAIDSASAATYRIECSNQTVEDLLNKWLNGINDDLLGVIPTGIPDLSREYFNELWKGSSFSILRAKDWKDLTIGGNKILIPKALYFANGASIYTDRPSNKIVELGKDKYFLDKEKKNPLPGTKGNEVIVVQKNGARWQDAYPIPYIIRKGIYKNHKALQILMDKGDETITKALPYLFLLTAGSDALAQMGINYKDADLKKYQTELRADIEKYKNEKGKLPALVDTWDKKYSHLIPDFRPILSQDLFVQGYRAILAGLGFIDLLEISISRQETRLNPKPFIASINSGVDGFKSILTDLVKIIIKKNIEDHRKIFSENNAIAVVSSPLRINTEQILDIIRSAYDRGNLSKRSFVETIGYDYDQEKIRRQKEADDGDEDLMYPQIITNQEEKGKDTVIPSKPKNEKNEKQGKKPGTPEVNDYKNASQEIAKCKKCGNEFDYLATPEAGMGWVKCPKCEEAVSQDDLIIAPYNSLQDLLSKHPNLKKYPVGAQKVFMEVFNSIYKETGDEARAFAGAYSKLHKWMKRHGGKGENK